MFLIHNNRLKNIILILVMKLSIVTVTRNRRWALSIMKKNWEIAKKYADEWIILDDGKDDLSSEFEDERIKYIFLDSKKILDSIASIQNTIDTIDNNVFDAWRAFHMAFLKIPIGKKRNMAVEIAQGEVIMFMDDDDIYFEKSLQRINKFENETTNCVYSRDIICYNSDNYIGDILKDSEVSEATLMFRKSFWQERKFNELINGSEGIDFIKNRKTLDLNAENMFVTLQHNSNTSSRVIEKTKANRIFGDFVFKNMLKDFNIPPAFSHHFAFDFDFKKENKTLLILGQGIEFNNLIRDARDMKWNVKYINIVNKESVKMVKELDPTIVCTTSNFKNIWSKIRPDIVVGEFKHFKEHNYIDVKFKEKTVYVSKDAMMRNMIEYDKNNMF